MLTINSRRYIPTWGPHPLHTFAIYGLSPHCALCPTPSVPLPSTPTAIAHMPLSFMSMPTHCTSTIHIYSAAAIDTHEHSHIHIHHYLRGPAGGGQRQMRLGSHREP